MKFIAVPILILLIMTQTFAKWAVVASFYMNKGYISLNLCENRFRPVLKCKGNCVLMKKMRQEEKQEQNSSGTLKQETPSFAFSSKSFFATAEEPVFISNIIYRSVNNSGKPVDRQASIFHPPSV